MAWPVAFDQRATITWANRDFALVPIGIDEASNISRVQRSELQRFDSPALEKVEEYSYQELPASKKRIRLLQLRSGTTHGPEIFCELIDADYSNDFHIPTIPMDDTEPLKPGQKRKRRDQEYAEYGVEEENSASGSNGEENGQNDSSQGTTDAVPKGEKAKKQEELKILTEKWDRVLKHEIVYEALSWCWGNSPEEYAVQIIRNGKTYKKRVRRELALALKYLRKPHTTRTLWIDAICINQNDDRERNQQVQMMSRIYTRAAEVCIWLGEDTYESKVAIDFISQEITQLNNFDSICSDKKYTDKWRALMMLMQRDWFSRRWVVQEIALAKKAKIYCGPDSIPWKDFAVAVELFVEVETATHRLSEVMQKDEKFRHVPGWFEYVSELGASLLVQATGKVFRAQRTPLDDHHGDDRDPVKRAQQHQEVYTIDPLDRRSLLSLEYLVTTMFIFNATECRDSVYSMLAIARDANPFAESTLRPDDVTILTMSLFDSFLAEKPFVVDYARPYADVCRDFIEFCINRKSKLDAVQALDILCRPWALEPQKGSSIRLPKSKSNSAQPSTPQRITPEKSEEEQARRKKYKAQLEKQEQEITADPEKGQEWVKIKDHVAQSVKPFKATDTPGQTGQKSQYGQVDYDLELPSWISRASKAPFKIFAHPGIHISKTGRANADPLVGHPRDGHRNYSAAQSKPVELDRLRFRKRPVLKHYSLYVSGFQLDEVEEVRDASQGGDIPESWLELGDWKAPYLDDPPAKFWRTIVADRGHDNRNPPYYYARACKESVHKGGIASGRVATTDLINNERNSIIAEFCRRVHAVIWGRCLFKTVSGRLGLATKVQKGDLVCILYGCTVPVMLQRFKKKPAEREQEELEDAVQAMKRCMRRLEKICLRKQKYNEKTKADPGWEKDVKKNREVVNQRLKEIREKLKSQNTGRDDTDKSNKGGKEATHESQAKEDESQFYYIFKGESYVHGFMDGEALRDKFYGSLADKVFELR